MQKTKSRVKRALRWSILLAALGLTACAASRSSTNLNNVDTANLSQLEAVRNDPVRADTTNNGTDVSAMRAKMLEDTALSLGAQGGLSWASQRINVKLESDRKYLETIYNFNAMLLSHGVLPPVLEASTNNLNQDDPDTIRVADRSYKIIQQARFVTTPPNWREYLVMSYPKPALPDKSLLPRSSEEQRVWKDGIAKGWENGIKQSYSIFQQNLARLKRDYAGMIIYRKLLQARMISPPFVATTDLGVTGDGTNMRVNDQVLRIVSHPKLQTNGNNWKAIVVKPNDQ